MTMDLGELLIEYYATEADLEATCTFVGERDITSILSTSLEDVELLPLLGVMEGADGDGTAGTSTEVVGANLFEGLGVKKLGNSIS